MSGHLQSVSETFRPRMSQEEANERWAAVLPHERERFLVYGIDHAPDETVPDYADRILKADPRISLANAGKLARIFRAAYNELATP